MSVAADPSLPAGVTSYPVERRRPADPGWFGIAGPLVGVVLVGVYGVVGFDASPLTLLLVAVGCYVLSPLAELLHLPLLVGVVVVMGGAAALVTTLTDPGPTAYACALIAFMSVSASLALRAWISRRRWWRRRLAGAEGEPASGLDPSHRRDVGTLAWWRDSIREYEAVEPRVELVLDAVRALDGHGRTFVSVYRGMGRLDVAGEAGGRMVVLQSDNRGQWSMVVTPTAPDRECRVPFGNEAPRYAERQTTDLAVAERVVRTWLERGTRDPGSEWSRGTALSPPYRPKSLKLTD